MRVRSVAPVVALVAGLAACTRVVVPPAPETSRTRAVAARAENASERGMKAAPARSRKAATLDVEGVGRARRTPDAAVASIGVAARAPTANAAYAVVARRAAALVRTLRRHGVRAADIRTTSLSLSPYTHRGRRDGYTASEWFRVRIRDVGRAGAVVARAVDAAGNSARIGGISLAFADASSLRSRARAAAVRDAMRRAREIARASQMRLGRLVRIEEIADGVGWHEPDPMPAYALGAGGEAPIEAGTQAVAVRVRAMFELR